MNDNQEWIPHTWHHHENTEDLFPVQSNIHNFKEGGFEHSGGNAIANGDPSLKGVFSNEPKFE